ncbi:hypothetical protein POJ06DRAFT_247644 [Lipomyces tetrasporus]|uniref:Zn(2)-C6 fungal-type domain-containing protein n=1 Tax=Lipomyces tetrasporus TaxID=54092 RepID=A0AAD7VUW8_9ASCO|nr:uncharacterized protein POJ06DRAFT_247644 [Lipomyces tetrasporus]KAJ8101695.1 hypothetical protein POJ06DRAFT_247644 [Lipomyces tetrasporus]
MSAMPRLHCSYIRPFHGSSITMRHHSRQHQCYTMQSHFIHHGTFSAASAVSYSDHPVDFSTRKRVGKACDACRIKKSKCDGRRPCSRCIADDKICVFTERRRSTDKFYSASYVELLESRIEILQQGIELLVQHISRGDSITSLLDDDGKISINKIVDKLSIEGGAFAGENRWSHASARASSVNDEDEVDGHSTESDGGLGRKRRHEVEDEPVPVKSAKYATDHISPIPESFFDPPSCGPTSIHPSYSALSEAPSLVSSPSIASSFYPSPRPDIASLTLELYGLDLPQPFLTFDSVDKTMGGSNDMWSIPTMFEV